MGSSVIEVRRQDQELGRFSPGEIRTLLGAGFLQPTDEFKSAGETAWRKLSALANATSTESLTSRIKAAVAKAAKPTGRLLTAVSEKTGMLAESQKDVLVQASHRALMDYLPQLRQQTASQLSAWRQSASSVLKDEVFLRKLFGAVYDAIPKPVYRFVSEEQFVRFCLKHRQRLLTDVERHD